MKNEEKNMKKLVKKHLTTIVGITGGAIAGYFYWRFFGCSSGTCAISSNPVNSMIYGATLGGLLFSYFQKNNQKKAV